MTPSTFPQLLGAFFRLIRWKNILMVAVSMYLARYALIYRILAGTDGGSTFTHADFCMLVLSVVFITAGGYLINDFFDIRIDRINKGDRVVLGRYFSLRFALYTHHFFSAAGMLLGFYASYRAGSLSLGGLHVIGVAILWFYAARYKRIMILGNVVVSLLSALVIPLVWLFEFFALRQDGVIFASAMPDFAALNRVVLLYLVFSFLLSMSREIVKDIQDMHGDRIYQCRTYPVLYGNRSGMLLAGLFQLLSLVILAIILFYLAKLRIMPLFYYILFLITMPLLGLFYQTVRPGGPVRTVEQGLKLLMFIGILSMIFIQL
ncbi:MAG TPA: geranylgeranylglycerol-phosphate geranylgeranyltransferase [Bacteroidales bacterium]|nr:geranylgeranylglycerol-phosphate geranylgeranyltransferase [Bacteroidales bacterium]HSA44195.1 geranylgeranylglycerol-phosphate geranylgeranyltransferase [Bacteroidales bacterium]